VLLVVLNKLGLDKKRVALDLVSGGGDTSLLDEGVDLSGEEDEVRLSSRGAKEWARANSRPQPRSWRHRWTVEKASIS